MSAMPFLSMNMDRSKLFTVISIILFSFLLYGNTVFNDYALDDELVITKNKFTQMGIKGIKGIFSYDYFKGYDESYSARVYGGRYRPISMASFAVENELFGKNPHISHFFNVLYYTLCCILIFFLFSMVFKDTRFRKWYFNVPFIATLIFLAHPIHTEVVANIKSRDEIFSLLFSIISFILIWKYFRDRKHLFLSIAGISFFTALLSKENSVVFLILIPLAFYFFTKSSLKEILVCSIPLIIATVTFLILRHVILSGTFTNTMMSNNLMADPFKGMAFSQKIATITYSFGLGLKLMIFPHPLTWDYYPYQFGMVSWSDIQVLISFPLFFALLFIFVWGIKSKRLTSYCILFFLSPLCLTLNIFFSAGGPFFGERFLFIPSLGFALMFAYLIEKNNLRIFSRPLVFLIPLMILYSFKTISRNMDWKNDESLIEKDYKTSSSSGMSNSYYGYELYLKGEKCNDQGMKQYYFEKALKCCEKAISINPDMHLANFVSGSIYLDYKQDFKNAEFYLSKALELNPVHLETCINLGVTYNESKQYEKAVLAFEKAFIIDSLNETVTSNLALAYNNLAFNCPDKSKRPEYYEKALLNCQRAFQLKPESGIANFVAGSIYITYKNDLKGAVKFLERSISSNPKYTASYNLLGYAYFRSMQYNKAIKVFEKGLKVMPNEISFMKNLASIKEKTGNSQKAGE